MNLVGQNIFITGATSGIGKVAALKLANDGATVIATYRNDEKGETLLQNFKDNHPNSKGKLELIKCNLSSFESISEACKKVKNNYDNLDAIINNAGIMNFSLIESENKIEEIFHVNLLAPVLISHLLINSLEKSDLGKLIFTTSGLHQGKINFNNIELKINFSGFKSYSQTKLGLILLTKLFAINLSKSNIGVYSNHPGLVRTDIARTAGIFSKLFFYLMGKSPLEGAKTLIYLSENENRFLKSGEYYADCKIAETSKESYNIETATNLLNVCKTYLINWISYPSAIFPNS